MGKPAPNRYRAMAVIGTGCGLVNLADVSAFGVKGRIGLRSQPITKAMRFEVGLFFKKRPTERCEMLIGRSLSDGFSQVIAITAQICSGGMSQGNTVAGPGPSASNHYK
jgi:hypothetical protein